MSTKLYKIMCGACAAVMMASCVDTVILPDDKTVDEDFWKSKSDVQLMVNGAYQSMLSNDVITRLIVWGDLRSDELIPASSITGTTAEDLIEINLANTQPDNEFATWGSLYTVINNCNIVLKKAAEVMDEDPSYTQGDYLADCSQMLALRSLCYFYLVRNFRDVPYITEAFMSSDQERNVPQSAPSVVLEGCINDLQQAEQNAISASAYNDWRRVGYFTRDGIQALLADIYLWRASVTHSSADYEQAVAYCDKVIESKKRQHVKGRFEVEEKEYPLEDGQLAFSSIFVEQNAEESILELQFNGQENYVGNNYRGNQGICQSYCHCAANNTSIPFLYASGLFNTVNASNSPVYSETDKTTNDYRRFNNTYFLDVTVGDFTCVRVRKFVTTQTSILSNTVATDPSVSRAYTAYSQNYPVYRLSDVMLMKAEALTALASDDADVARLHPAFDLVKAVNLRSKVAESDSLSWDGYNSGIAAVEELVLRERLRELCFEGKRWYDLMRYNYRHVEGVDYNTMLADQENFVTTNTDMLNLVARKLDSKGSAVAAKLSTEPRLYMPVPLADLKICPVLRQNPAYSSTDDYSKNY